MIRRERDFEIFSISFLDVISCGFGAVVLLVLISKTAVTKLEGPSDISSLLKAVYQNESTLAELSSQLKIERGHLEALKDRNRNYESRQTALSAELQSKRNEVAKLEDDQRGLELVQSSLKTASIAQSTARKRDLEVGGIPVDSDYVIFVIDTSGSMLKIWGRVLKTIGHVLDIHPTVKGFQVLNDEGIYLLEAYRRKWIPDTPARRASVLRALTSWRAASNSSPVEGIEAALKGYARPDAKISIYVFGDDFTGSSYEAVIKSIQLLNLNRVSGKPIVKVHGVGFISGHTTNRYSILMREIAKRNGGTFLGLPQ